MAVEATARSVRCESRDRDDQRAVGDRVAVDLPGARAADDGAPGKRRGELGQRFRLLGVLRGAKSDHERPAGVELRRQLARPAGAQAMDKGLDLHGKAQSRYPKQ